MVALISRRLCFPILLLLLHFASWIGVPALDGHAQTASALSAVPATILLGQPLRFERFTLEDGLSQNTVFTLLQDHQSHLWIGTQDGLDRYDGYGFTVFKRDPQNSNSLSNNGVWNDAGLAIPLDITPPVWQTWWFLGGIVILAIAILATGYTVRSPEHPGPKTGARRSGRPTH